MPFKDIERKRAYFEAYLAQYRPKHQERINELSRQWHQRNRDKVRQKHARYYEQNQDRLRAQNNQWKRANRAHVAEYGREWGFSLKAEVLTHYGNGKLACVSCGFADIRALSIDHINNDGAKHRREDKLIGGRGIYRWLKEQGYPEGFQTLCMNCQWIKRWPLPKLVAEEREESHKPPNPSP